MNEEFASRLIAEREAQRIEFKASFAEDNEAIESLCAFANADGGTVFFGVSDDGVIVGVRAGLGKNTIANFANKVRRHTQAPLAPSIERISLSEKLVVAVTVRRATQGTFHHAFNTAWIRVGDTNQVMSPEEQRARLLAGIEIASAGQARPTFEVSLPARTTLESGFEPYAAVRHVSGDKIANLEWRFRGPRFQMEWRATTFSALERTNFGEKFDLSQPPIGDDDQVGANELGFELRFSWRGRPRHELHRWPITREELPHKIHWDVGDETLPPHQFDG